MNNIPKGATHFDKNCKFGSAYYKYDKGTVYFWDMYDERWWWSTRSESIFPERKLDGLTNIEGVEFDNTLDVLPLAKSYYFKHIGQSQTRYPYLWTQASEEYRQVFMRLAEMDLEDGVLGNE